MAQLDFSAAAAPSEPAASARPEAERTGRGSLDAPFCMTCGVLMRRAGSCYVCANCGATSGCS